MEYFQYALQIIAGLGILNVWLLRRDKPTPYRGGNASSMTKEFANYGLPNWSVYVVGFLKIVSALGLLIGLFFQPLVVPSALLLTALMLGALGMHLKVNDPFLKSVPALTMLSMTVIILLCEL